VLSRLVQDPEFCRWFDEHSRGRLHDVDFWIAAGKVAAARWAELQPVTPSEEPTVRPTRRAARG
jgi:hypothetical protein